MSLAFDLNMRTKTESLWSITSTAPEFPKLNQTLNADVVVIGGGITGLTAAYLLKTENKKVILLEKEKLLSGETGKTTAHLTEIIDTRYRSIISNFDLETACKVADSSRQAIQFVSELVKKEKIECGFEFVPAYLYADQENQLSELRKEYKAVKKVGLPAEQTHNVPIPFKVFNSIRFENQAQFNPADYLYAIAQLTQGDGCYIFENSQVIDIQDQSPCIVKTENGSVIAQDVIVATDAPISNRYLVHQKIANYRTYALAAKVDPSSDLDQIPNGLYWDLQVPYHYTRFQTIGSQRYCIIGGEDHKVGMETQTEERFENLKAYAKEHFNIQAFDAIWSGQVIEPFDGLPFIGRAPATRHVWLATGFSGNGTTFGTLAAQILSDLIIKGENVFRKTYKSTRFQPWKSPLHFINENKDFPLCFLKDRLNAGDVDSIHDVPPGEGKIVSTVDQNKIAVYRSDTGKIHALSPVCTHLGCHIRWNQGEKSWDCPCHGSRFGIDGRVLHGPATQSLKKMQIYAEYKITERRTLRRQKRKKKVA